MSPSASNAASTPGLRKAEIRLHQPGAAFRLLLRQLLSAARRDCRDDCGPIDAFKRSAAILVTLMVGLVGIIVLRVVPAFSTFYAMSS